MGQCFSWNFIHTKNPVRTEPVEVPVHPEPVEGTEPVEVPQPKAWDFDRLSPNGVGFVFDSFVFPIILSLSKGRLSPNGVGFAFGSFVFPIVLSLSKGRLSPNGVREW
jgi:hypothetical protein